MEQRIVSAADRASDVFVRGRLSGSLGVKQIPARVDEVLPTDGVRCQVCGRGHLASSPRLE